MNQLMTICPRIEAVSWVGRFQAYHTEFQNILTRHDRHSRCADAGLCQERHYGHTILRDEGGQKGSSPVIWTLGELFLCARTRLGVCLHDRLRRGNMRCPDKWQEGLMDFGALVTPLGDPLEASRAGTEVLVRSSGQDYNEVRHRV